MGNFDAEYFMGNNNLRKAFESYGKITRVRLMHDERGLSRGFGFVCFERAEDADTAMREMNGMMIGSMPLCVNAVCPSLSPRELDLDLFRVRSTRRRTASTTTSRTDALTERAATSDTRATS